MKRRLLDPLRPRHSICPWCNHSDRAPKIYKNGTHPTRRLLRSGHARMIRIERGWPGYRNFDRTICAHPCHEA